MDNTHEWCAEGVSPQIDNLQDLPSDMFPWWMEKLRNGETIHIEDVSELPGEAEAEKETLESQNIKSVLVLPVFESNELAGFIGFDDCEEIGDWSDEALFALRVISTTIGNSLEKRRVEDALRERESRLQNLFDTMSEGVILTDPDGQIVEANPAAERILGLERSEIEGRNYVDSEWDIIRPDGSPMPAEEMAGPQAMREKRSIENVEMGIRQPDGSVTWIMVSASPLLREDGNLEGIVGTFVDITERKKVEGRLSLAQQFAYVGIWEYDFKDEFLYWNPECERVFGLEEGEFEGTFEAFLQYVHPEDRDFVLEENEPVFQRNQNVTLTFEYRIIRKDGETRWVRELANPVTGEDGTVDRVVGMMMDITERKKAEEGEDFLHSLLRHAMTENGQVLEPGRVYLIEYGEPMAYLLYKETLDGGGQGLCVSSEHPGIVKSEMGITSGETIWLSEEGKDEKISPRNLENLRDTIMEFVEKNGEEGTILLDGLEYLTTTNGFERALEFFHDIRGKVASKKATAIIPVSPSAFEERQIALLERYSEMVETVE